MALQNPNTDEYLKVISFRQDFISGDTIFDFALFKNKYHRDRAMSGSKTPYEREVKSSYSHKDYIEKGMLNKKGLSSKNFKNNIVTRAYETLKIKHFKDWEDV